MAMNLRGAAPAMTIAEACSHEYDGHNDGFSFWKLAENWRDALEPAIAESERRANRYLLEGYLQDEERRPPSGMDAYYRIKHLIPTRLRFRINSMAVRSRTHRTFPAWPCESALMDYWRAWLSEARTRVGLRDGWHIGFWPGGARCCIVLTHDIESAQGFELMEAVAAVEERYGFRSAWNLPLAQYEIDWTRIAEMRHRGFEFGAHGLSHDGRLFRSLEDFAGLSPTLQRLAAEHDLAGFRAPSTLRRAEWIASMSFDFDSSFSDTDPWEPQPGGSCSLFPFHLGRLIELPYTLPQDHTLIHLVHRAPLQIWSAKARWIESLGGMILTLTHPDYIGTGRYLAEYEQLLERLSTISTAWRALPSEVADWWRRRARLQLHHEGETVRIVGPDPTGAVAVRLSAEPLAN